EGTRRVTAADIARVFDVPVELIEDRDGTYLNAEQERAITFAELALGVPLLPWQRDMLARAFPEPDETEQPPAPDDDRRKAHGDPQLGGDGIRIPVDANCPACGWPERVFDTITRRFGCVRCAYTSDERNA
ncbi:hypothetical protein ACEPTV_33380, partial [Burkholderia pseudomallei]|uniref:hypothetical protein n=1 Tax=Burkholderia pseudomallei TaxID=28450 RepID=UPI0035901905